MTTAFGSRARALSRRAVFGLAVGPVLFATLVALCAAPIADSATPTVRSYTGSLRGYSETSVQLTVSDRGGEADNAASVEARSVPTLCEGETDSQIDFPPISVHFFGRRTFEGQRYYQEPSAGARQLFKVYGRLVGGGQARGFVFYFDDNCSTDGLLRFVLARAQ
jgi:hypothetical protein